MAKQSRDWENDPPPPVDFNFKITVHDELKDIERRFKEADKAAEARAKQATKEEKKQRHHKHGKTVVADTSGSTAFSDLRFKHGEAFATFSDGSQYSYPMSRDEFEDWAEADSLGSYFNDVIR
jgi:hypothetical protein